MFTKFFEGLTAIFEESRNRAEEVKAARLDRAEALLASTLQGLKAA